MSQDGVQPPETSSASQPLDRSLAEAVRTVALELNDSLRATVTAKAAFEPDGVHDIRVATKRLRALWQLVRPVIEPQIARNADQRLRDAARSLAAARDASVLIDLLASLRNSEEPLYHGAFDRAGGLLDEEPDLSAEAEELRSDLLAAIDEDRDDWRILVLPDNRSLVDHGLGRTYRKTRRRAETAGRTHNHHDNHSWRRWVKYLRYQMEALATEVPEVMEARIVELQSLGHRLGKRNDLAILRQRIESRGEGDPFGAVFRSIEMRDRALARGMPEESERLFGASPEEFAATIAAEIAGDDSPA